MQPSETTRFDFNYEELSDLHAIVMDSRQLNWEGHASRCPATCTMCPEIAADHDRWLARLEKAMAPYETAMEREGF